MDGSEEKTKIGAPILPKPFILLNRYGNIASGLLYVIGIICSVAVVWPAFNGKTYFSENALLPGLVDSEFSQNYNNRMMSKLMTQFNNVRNEKDRSPFHTHLLSAYRDIGIDSYVQHFNVTAPSVSSPRLRKAAQTHGRLSGTNVYAIVRAPRGDSTESIVVCARAEWQLVNLHAMLLTFAKHSQDQIYWAKDIIFVSVEHGALGLNAFLRQYHGDDTERNGIYGTSSDDLHIRGGNIIAALCVDHHEDQAIEYGFSHMDISYTMLDGKLPNLDLFNLVVKLATREGFQPTLYGYENLNQPYTLPSLEHMLRTSARGLQSQAFGGTTYRTSANNEYMLMNKEKGPIIDRVWHSLHSVFGAYNIDALTVRPYLRVGVDPRRQHTAKWHDLAKLVEGVSRSINNLLEILHQSFFFYYLPCTMRYVSIGYYMIGLGCFLASLIVKALLLWTQTSRDLTLDTIDEINAHHAHAHVHHTIKDHLKEAESKKEKAIPRRRSRKNGHVEEESDDEEEVEKSVTTIVKVDHSLLGCLPFVLCAHLSVALVHAVIFYSTNSSFVLATLIAVSVAPYMMARMYTFTATVQKGLRETTCCNIRLLHCLLVLHAAAVIAVVSLFNYALAFLLAVVVGLLSLTVRATRNNLVCMGNNLLLVVCHPLSLVFIYHLVIAVYEKALLVDNFDNVLMATIDAGISSFASVHQSYTEYRVLSSVTLLVYIHGVLPVHWLATVVVNCSPVERGEVVENKEE